MIMTYLPYLRVDTPEGASWMTELALPWEGNGLRSKT